jgi:hypothetical protein
MASCPAESDNEELAFQWRALADERAKVRGPTDQLKQLILEFIQ